MILIGEQRKATASMAMVGACQGRDAMASRGILEKSI